MMKNGKKRQKFKKGRKDRIMLENIEKVKKW